MSLFENHSHLFQADPGDHLHQKDPIRPTHPETLSVPSLPADQKDPSLRSFHWFPLGHLDPLDHLLRLAILELLADLWDPSHHLAIPLDPLLPLIHLFRSHLLVPSVPSHRLVFLVCLVVLSVLSVLSRHLFPAFHPNRHALLSFH
jgi:hypothetical protein